MSKVIVPLKFGPESEVEIPRATGPLYRRLRRMSKHPRQPAIWSKEKYLLTFAIISAPLFLTWWIDATKDYFLGRGQGLIQVIVPLYPLLISLFMLAYGLWRRFGVDDDKVWTRFGKVFYREVRFSEVTRFRTGVERYKLNTADSVVNVDYNKYDYSLVFMVCCVSCKSGGLRFRIMCGQRTQIGSRKRSFGVIFWRRIFSMSIVSFC